MYVVKLKTIAVIRFTSLIIKNNNLGVLNVREK